MARPRDRAPVRGVGAFVFALVLSCLARDPGAFALDPTRAQLAALARTDPVVGKVALIDLVKYREASDRAAFRSYLESVAGTITILRPKRSTSQPEG